MMNLSDAEVVARHAFLARGQDHPLMKNEENLEGEENRQKLM